MFNSQSGNANSLKNAASLFEPVDKQTNASEERIAQLEQLVGRFDPGIGHPKKSLNLAELTPAEKTRNCGSFANRLFGATDLRYIEFQSKQSLLSTEKGTFVKKCSEIK